MHRRILILLFALLAAAGCGGAPAAMEAATPVPAEAGTESAVDSVEPAVYSNVVVTVRRNAETVSERAVTDSEEIRTVQEIVFDYMVKSAAFEGVEISELEDGIWLSFDSSGDAGRQVFCQYDTEGRHALQWGEAGMYTIMSDGAYEKLLTLAGLMPDASISVEEAAALLTERFGEADERTGNVFSFGFVEPLNVDGRDYYRFRVSWLVDNDHLSYLTDYLVSTDGTELMEYLPEEQTAKEDAYQLITAEEAKAILDGESDYVLLDVRTLEEFRQKHIPGAILIPDDEIARRAEAELPDKGRLILVYCRSGRRSAAAARTLVEMGYENVKDFGGILSWPYETVSE